MLGLSSSLVKGGTIGRQYIKDGLKLYMPYKGADTNKGVQFVGTGSTSFDGSGDYIHSAISNFEASSGQGTISAWIKTSTTGGRIFTSSDEAADDKYIGLIVHLNKFYIQTSVGSNLIGGGTTITDGVWHHVVATSNGSAYTLYVDGSSETLAVTAGSNDGDWFDESPTQRDNITIGVMKRNAGLDGDFTGNIKNVALWNRALTATEIQNVMYKTYAEVSGRLASGLVSWWGLDVDYTDSHGDNDGTNSGSTLDTDLYGGDTPVIPRAIDNAPTVQADAIGSGSALFDGTDDYINAGELSDALKNKADMSISVWIYPTHSASGGDTYHTIASQWDGSGSDCWGLWLRAPNNATTSFIRYDNTMSNVVEDGTAIVEVNKWSHIAVSKDGTTTKLYHNGVEVHSGTSDAATGNQTEELLIAAQNKSSPTAIFKGNISQLGLWDAVLTQAQIQSVMEKTYEELDASEKEDLVSYWALDVDGSDSHGDNDGTLT